MSITMRIFKKMCKRMSTCARILMHGRILVRILRACARVRGGGQHFYGFTLE